MINPASLIPPQYKLAAKLVLMAIVVSAILFALYRFGESRYSDGFDASEARWLKKENKELADANAQIEKLTREASEKESVHAQKLNEISIHYERQQQDEKARNNKILASVRAGTLRLHDPAGSADCPYSAASPNGEAAASASGSDVAKGCDISIQTSEFLVSLASEADDNTRQLAEAQAVIIEDRRVCGK